MLKRESDQWIRLFTRSRAAFCACFRATPSRLAPFDNAYPLLGVKAFMPPQGLLVIAAYLPKALGGSVRRRERAAGEGAGFPLG